MIEDSGNDPTHQQDRPVGGFLINRPWLIVLVFGVLFVVLAIAVKWQQPVTVVDLNQPWLNTALPPPDENSDIEHTFTPIRNGLSEIELEIARYGSENSNSRLGFQLQDAAGKIIAAETWKPEAQANQPYTLEVAPQSDSAGQLYKLTISGSEGNTFAPWGYDLDILDDSEVIMLGSETTAVELHFTTRYQLSFAAALAGIASATVSNAGFIILSILFMLLPGILILLAAWPHARLWDPAAWIGAALALGIGLWALLWLWLSLGISWTRWSLWLVFILGWLSAILLFLWRSGWRLQNGKPAREQATPITRPFQKRHLLLFAILLLGLTVRLLAVRDLAFPAWVDSSRHGLITAVMSGSGRVITDYAPYLPVSRFPYHFGFHTLSASLSLMTGMELQHLLLILGQLLNALVPLTAFAGVYLITKRFRTALLTAFLISLPFLFPGYYATWGRMTQLTAMAILPIVVAFTWLLIRGVRGWRKGWWLLALLVSGLLLTHFRVFLFYLPFAALVWLFSKGRHGRWLAFAAGFSIFLTGPRIIRAFDDLKASGMSDSIPGYNSFPTGYTEAGGERYFLIIAAVFIFIALAAVLRSRHWAWFPLFLTSWVGLVALILSGWLPGIPHVPLVNMNSAYISLFLPLSWILAVVFDRIWIWLHFRSWPVRLVGWGLTGAVLAAAILMGVNQQVDILNPQTILAQQPDNGALTWLDENLPQDAMVAVNSWQWLGSTWAGNDGGAWILPLTGRQTTTPPVDYIYDPELSRQVASFNQIASEVEDWSELDQAAWLRDMGITHIYVGARGGFFDPSELSRNPEISMIFQRDGVFIFTVQ